MLRANRLRSASGVVLLGSAAGHLVGLAALPVLARLYAPGDFGVFASVVAVSSLFVGVSTFRLEVLAQRTSSEGEARRLIRLGLATSVWWSVAVTVICVAVVSYAQLSVWWLAVGPLIALSSLQLLGAASLVRGGRYRGLALANFSQGAGVAGAQVAAGLVTATAGALLLGFALGRLGWLAALGPGSGRPGPVSAWRASRRFALAAGSSAAINSVAGQLPLLLIAWLLGSVEAGYYAMALRLLVSPLSVVGQAVASAVMGEIGREIRGGELRAAGEQFRRGVRGLVLVGIVPCAVVALLAPSLAPLVLGAEWRLVGPVLTALSVGALAQFVASPFSQLLNVTGRHRNLLWWDASRLVLVAGSIVVPTLLGGGIVAAAAAYSVAATTAYLVLLRLVQLSMQPHPAQ